MAQNIITKIKKRDGTIVDFDQAKITAAVFKAITAAGQGDGIKSKKVSDRVAQILSRRFKKNEIPEVEQVQDIVEEVLILEGLVETAKSYILYREQRRNVRDAVAVVDESSEMVDKYLQELDWQIKENANMTYSLQGLNQYSISSISKKYWLNKIYPKEIRDAAANEDLHIHNLDTLAPYCEGWDLYDLLLRGFGGVPGKIESKPAKHLRTALGQLVNFLFTLQGESAGANAVSNFDTLLAPFIRYDNLTYQQVRQSMQEFLFNCMVPTRVGFQTPFLNVSLDIKIPGFYKNQPVIIGGKPQKETYGEFQEEVNMLIRAFYEGLMEGDAKGRVFTFPIPTVSITKDFDWDNPALIPMWEATAKYGVNYFSNFIHSDMNPEDFRSMCCRLRLDNKELLKRGGGLFGSAPLTGCYDEKTEILTENGWQFFKDLTTEQNIFTLTDNNKIELHKPVRTFQYDYQGEMYQFKTKSLDLLVTPNHRMAVDNRRKEKREFVEAKDFKPDTHWIPKQGIWEAEEKQYFELPPVVILSGAGPVSHFSEEEIETMCLMRNQGVYYRQIAGNFNCNPVTVYNVCAFAEYGNRERVRVRYEASALKIKMDDWLKFFGFWTAEGCTDNEEIAKSHGYRTVVTQVHETKREEFKEVLGALPFNYSEEGPNFVICNKQLWSYLRQFGNKYHKFIPKEIKNLNKRQLNILFDWMVKGDGHIRKTNGQINYWTSSKELADDLQEIILKLGWLGTSIAKQSKVSQIRGRVVKSGIIYNIGVQKTKHYRLRKNNPQKVYYEGKVYCCEVENHTVFVRRNGKVTWCGNSIGVVTINLPRIGYLSKTKKDFFDRVGRLMDLSRESLEIKRKALENFMEKGLFPYSRYYLASVKKIRDSYFGNHFSTIGLMGMNEALLNFIGKNIASREGKKFALEVLDFMRERLVKYQTETGNLYNLEATPGEGTSYRQAKSDKEKYPDIITAGTKKVPYYTNSSQLPVNYTDDIFEALKLQDECQCKYTGGCIEKGNKVLTNKGLLQIEEIVKNFQKLRPIKALSYNVGQKISEWDEIVEAVKINVQKHNKIRVKGERGLNIVTSDWHPFFVLKRFKPNPACPICKEETGNIKAFASHIRWNLECQEKYDNFPKYQVIEKRADELKPGDYILQNSSNIYPDIKTELDNNLMWLIGFFIGDGCASRFIDNRGGNHLERYTIRFFSEHQPALEKITKILNKYFECEAKVIQNDIRSKKLREVTTSRKKVADFFFKY
ncbi:MAG: ribonucleoside triphosphate reductase, partial [bacterium]|nr:ribonucleoside triphosphate reductase [bacterium]